ncbi:uncharacterized protein LOC119791865 [Cyprinodon tularosa]|uniref:uncharacterized protein LOC119791865 n=1 Tax=Cyprinodon tularosa TaxID=77115 RepID=UPI0018E22E88|nr:uncharacterized protein LOC119791865 [Cyprinodon tularosa]
MFLLSLFLGIWLLPTVDSIECYNCPRELSQVDCTTKRKCATEDYLCGTGSMVRFEGGSKHSENKARGCVLPHQCLNGSINTGSSKLVVTSVCCKSNLCNSQDFPEPPEFSSNGKKCFKCVGSDCTGSVNCEGNEDYCYISKVKTDKGTITEKGCASKLICSENSVNWFSFNCQGDNCNGAGIISVQQNRAVSSWAWDRANKPNPVTVAWIPAAPCPGRWGEYRAAAVQAGIKSGTSGYPIYT